VIVVAAGTTILAGVEAVFNGFGPTLVAEAKDILTTIEADFLKGSTLDMIAEEVLKTASDDFKAAVKLIGPQLFSTIIGVILHAL
jgi:hypothetical protein